MSKMEHQDPALDEKDALGVHKALPVDGDEEMYEVMNSPEEKRLTRKMDIFLIPALGVMYLLSFLDRGNIGNANIATPSMSTALHLSAKEYGAAVSVVYATYVVFEPVWANLLKVITPKIMMSVTALGWSALTLGTAWSKNYQQLMAIRILLGVFEASVFPSLTTYILMNYRREEVGVRTSYIMSCSAISGAVGGLIAYGLVHIESGSITGWQYLYIVEGILSFCCAPFLYFWIPNDMRKAWFLNAENRKVIEARVELNKRNYDPDEQFSWRQVARGLTEWKTYVTGVIQFCTDCTLYGLSTFMPAIIKGMGYSNVNAQLLTVPVYFVGAASFLTIAHFSDKRQERAIWISLGFTLQIIGYVILAAVQKPGGRYVGVFISAMGLYAPGGLNVAWVAGNVGGHYKRATAFGINQLIGNSAGACIGQIYLSTLAPRYLRSMYISIGLSSLGLCLTVTKGLILRYQNKKREELCAAGAPDQPHLADMNPHFRFLV